MRYLDTGCLILLANPKFLYVPESRKKQSPELATPKIWQSPGLPPLNSPQLETAIFWGWQVLDLGGGQFGTGT